VLPDVPIDEHAMLAESRPKLFYFAMQSLCTLRGRRYRRLTLAPERLARAYPVQSFTNWTAPALAGAFSESYRTTPDVNPAFLRGGLISFFNKQRASRPV
jgi:hypothetical protein